MRARPAAIAVAAATLLISIASGRDVPENIRKLRESIIARGDCQKKLASGFKLNDATSATGSYCGDLLDKYGIIYQQSPGGRLSDADVDCDGQLSTPRLDPSEVRKCDASTDTQPQTSFRDTIKGLGVGISDLNPLVHSYVVFGNTNEGKPDWPSFDPQDNGQKKLLGGKKVEPLSVMAVVCGERMFYAVWGDENGPDGKQAMMGEVGIGLARACFDNVTSSNDVTITGNQGYSRTDVLYLAFTGTDAAPFFNSDGSSRSYSENDGKNITPRWDATSFEEFESSLATVGEVLVGRIDESSSPGRPAGVAMWLLRQLIKVPLAFRRRLAASLSGGGATAGRRGFVPTGQSVMMGLR